MDINEIANKAVELKMYHGYNCCQAVATALADETNLTLEQLNQIGAGFCAGMGNLEATCGSLIGAVIVAGSKTEGKQTLQKARAMIETFEDMCGATICKDLKAKVDGKPLCPCEECVRNAVLAYGKVMNN
ncbi:MAG: C-GCAxxG-C-C family protein [Clostridia bacterium]|nr:C-GCAxxG-C-C family protein [Clostridia bacterium]